MTDEITPVAPNPMEMVITTNSAPTEQKSVEMATTEPKTPLEPDAPEPVAPVEPKPEPEPKAEPSVEDKANIQARKAIEAEMRADNLQRQLDAAKPKQEISLDKPNINDYKTLEEYETDLATYFKEEGKREERTALSQRQINEQVQKIRVEVAAKAQESRVKHPDFDQVVKPLAPIMDAIPILNDFIARNPMGTEVAYELAKNPALIEQLRNSDVWTAGEQLINLAARLKKPAVVEVSKAPEPINPVGSRETVRPKLAELAANDINGYMAKRNKDELAKKRAN